VKMVILRRRCGVSIAAVLLLSCTWSAAAEPLRVVTTTPDLADLARQIGGEWVVVTSLTRGSEDFHKVRPRPRKLIALSRADLLIQMGLDLEHAWLPDLVKSARNRKIRPGTAGWVNVSAGIEPLGVTEETTRADGPDLHPKGNPHFNLSPLRAQKMADNVLAGLLLRIPEARETLEKNHAAYSKRLQEKVTDWKARLEPLRGAALIEYHDSWLYFTHDFGLKIVARLEPQPGVSPHPKHLKSVIETGRKENVGLILARPANKDLAEKVARDLGATAVVLPLASTTDHDGYLEYLEEVVSTFEDHLKK